MRELLGALTLAGCLTLCYVVSGLTGNTFVGDCAIGLIGGMATCALLMNTVLRS